jgi:uroporphyrinogen-III synthase
MLASGVTGDVLHICGEPHRPEFASRMREAGCRMQEWVVYETVPINAELPNEPIDAVAFFSPAAVKQFKALGWTESLHVPYIAIGPTTASELSPSSCTVSDSATFRGVLETTRRILNEQF